MIQNRPSLDSGLADPCSCRHVVITGARQTGKTTLVRELLPERGRLYLALDDIDLLEPANRAPDDLVAPRPIALLRIGHEGPSNKVISSTVLGTHVLQELIDLP